MPRESNIKICRILIPKKLITKRDMAIAAAPAPKTKTRIFSGFLFCNSSALIRAAQATTAVPCWSSCNTGISSRRRKRCSIKKHSGARISSKLIAPKVGDILATVSINTSGDGAFISISKASKPANFLNNIALPSITGLLASAPILPSPSTAVPLLITPTRFPLLV